MACVVRLLLDSRDHYWSIDMKDNDKLRMMQWLLVALAFYLLAMFVVTSAQPQLQTALWKCGNVTLGSFLGYWLDRNALGRVTPYSTEGRQVSRAIVMGAAVLGLALGL